MIVQIHPNHVLNPFVQISSDTIGYVLMQHFLLSVRLARQCLWVAREPLLIDTLYSLVHSSYKDYTIFP